MSNLATARSKVWLIRFGVDGRAVGLGEHVAVVAALTGGHALVGRPVEEGCQIAGRPRATDNRSVSRRGRR